MHLNSYTSLYQIKTFKTNHFLLLKNLREGPRLKYLAIGGTNSTNW